MTSTPRLPGGPQDRIVPPLSPDLYLVPNTGAEEAPTVSRSGESDSDAVVESFTLVDGQVDDQALAELTRDGAVGRQVVPDWAKDINQVKDAVVAWLLFRWRVLAFHLVRVPMYVLRLVETSPFGLWRAAQVWGRWLIDADYKDDRALLKSNGGDVLKLKRDHHSNVSNRLFISFGATLAGGVAVLLFTSQLHWLVVGVLALGGLCLLGWYGAPMTQRPIIERASYQVHQAPPFTESLMLSALRQAGAEPKDARQIQVIQPPAKIRSGWEAVVSVGVEASAIIERRSRFATVVDRPVNCVWLSSDPEEAAGWLRIVITRKSLRRARIQAWPFLNGGSFNWFSDAVPIGVDETGAPVTAVKAYRSSVYGGIMGAGKSVSMLNSVLSQAVDPRVELHLYDLKGGTDWQPLEPIAHFYRSGSDAEDHRVLLGDLKDLNRRMDRRYKTLQGLPDELKSPKTTDRLASMRHLDLHPIVITIDETQELFEFASDAKKYQQLVSRLIKKGRAVGIVVEAGTQEVSKQTLPIAGLCHWRHCLSVQGHVAVDLVLGTGAYKAGFNADALTTDDVGIGYFGSGKEISVVKSYFIDPDTDLDNVVTRLHEQRQTLDLLTGAAVGSTPQDTIQESTLDRVVRVWPAGTTKLQWVELVNLLNSAMPDDYPKVARLAKGVPTDVAKAVDALSAQLGRSGIVARDVRSAFQPKPGSKSSVRKGISWTDLTAAQATRDKTLQDTEMSDVFDVDLDMSDPEPDTASPANGQDIESDDSDEFAGVDIVDDEPASRVGGES